MPTDYLDPVVPSYRLQIGELELPAERVYLGAEGDWITDHVFGELRIDIQLTPEEQRDIERFYRVVSQPLVEALKQRQQLERQLQHMIDRRGDHCS